MGYTKKAIQGVSWNSALKLAMTVLAAIKIAVLARILSQYDFGVFALVAVAIGIVESFTETGINATIIQSSKSIPYFLDTAWVISIIRGLLISIVMIVMGFGMQIFYGSPQLFLMVGLASFVPLIKGFINPAIVILQKEMHFFRDTVYRLSLLIVEAAVSIIFAFILRSVYALILGLLASAIFEVGLTFFMFKDKPRLHYLPSRAKEIFDNMKGLNMIAILGYVVENIDSLIVGKVTTTSALGVYQNSYGLTHRLNVQLAKSVQHATFPVYARVNSDQARLRRAFLRTLAVSLAGFLLLAVPFFLFPKVMIQILLGDNWLDAVPLIRPLLIAGFAQSIVSISSSLFLAQKHYSWLQNNLLLNTGLMVIFITYLGIHFGLQGAVYGLLLARLISLPIIFYGIHKTLFSQRPSSRWQL